MTPKINYPKQRHCNAIVLGQMACTALSLKGAKVQDSLSGVKVDLATNCLFVSFRQSELYEGYSHPLQVETVVPLLP